MTKKYFAQPEMMVVNISKRDIIVTSPEIPNGDPGSANNAEAPGLRNIFDPSNDWATAGY